MNDDDPRHGTPAGYSAHRRAQVPYCQPCRDAMARYQHQRTVSHYLGRPLAVPTLGFRRRIEALQAIGWSVNAIADRLGIDVRVLPARMKSTYVRSVMFERMAAIYNELCMTVPSDRYANRRRTIARRKGYAPPLAWDDIDTDLEPVKVADRKRDTVAEYEHLTSLGESQDQALKQLGITLDGLEQAMRRERRAA